MTTIAYRDGVIAADSRFTENSESGGSRTFNCQKLYRIEDKIIGLCGGNSGLVFLRWVRNGMDTKKKPLFNKDDDFSALVVTKDSVAVYDRYCEPEPLIEPYHAIGCGAKCAFVALDMGASAEDAVKAACRRDPYTAPPVVTMTLEKP